jgi:pimeloyl-ACP methyl ester carboxylesterase
VRLPLLLLLALLGGCAGSASTRTPASASPAPADDCPEARCRLPRGFVQAPGGALQVHRYGPSSTTLVVFVHDWAHDASVFYQQVSALRSRFPVLTYDLRGHGGSSDAAGAGATVAEHARDLEAVLDAAQAGSIHLVGQGLGGWIALEVAARRGGSVASVTLIGTLAEIPPAQRQQYRQLVEEFRADPASYRAWPDRFPLVWLSRRYLEARPDAIAFFDVMLERHDPASVAGTLEKVVDYQLRPQDLGRVGAPSLVLYGEEDRLPGIEEAERFFAALPRAQRLRIPGAGHEPHLENPTAVSAALIRHFAAASP